MRDKFWKLYEEVIRTERYYWYYRQRAIRIDKAIKAFLVIASLSSVAGIWLWEVVPQVWSLIAIIAQVVSACAYLLPYSERINATNNLLPALQHMQNQVDHDWDIIDSYSDHKINDLVFAYKEELTRLESLYASGGLFPVCKSVLKKAEDDTKKYKFSHLNVDQVDHLEEVLLNARS